MYLPKFTFFPIINYYLQIIIHLQLTVKHKILSKQSAKSNAT